MSNKSAPAVNILALAVTLFGAFSYLKTAPCVCRMTTLWTIHHIQIPTFAIRIIVMIHKISILRTLYSISRSSIFTSSSILVVKPLSGLTVCVRAVMVHSASSIHRPHVCFCHRVHQHLRRAGVVFEGKERVITQAAGTPEAERDEKRQRSRQLPQPVYVPHLQQYARSLRLHS